MKLVVVGTGTDVGKTHVTCAIARLLREQGEHVVAWKPIASGVDGNPGDAEAIAEAAGTDVIAPHHAFVPPISPHLAARRAGVAIDIGAVARRAEELAAAGGTFILETAGGLFSPLGADVSNADLVVRLQGARVILVAPDRLGVLHDLHATLVAAATRGLVVDAVALSAPAIVDASTGTNGAELRETLRREVAATFPRGPWSGREALEAAARVLAAVALG